MVLHLEPYSGASSVSWVCWPVSAIFPHGFSQQGPSWSHRPALPLPGRAPHERARERETGTFDQLLVTPLRPIDILLGKGLPGVLIGLIEASVIVVAAVWWFEVPLRGGLLPLYLGLLIFVIAVTGMGLMISALPATQQQALLGVFLFMVPSIILSGFATPIANMPEWVQDLTLVNPMRYFLVIVRGVFLEGASFSSLAAQYWPMALIGAASLAAAGWLFRSRVT
ncbi:MAG: ABC transporter permease [Roseiarcus sp.]